MTRDDLRLLVDFRRRYPGLTWVQLGRLFGISPAWERISVARIFRGRR